MNTFNQAFIKIFPASVPPENSKDGNLSENNAAPSGNADAKDSLAQPIVNRTPASDIASVLSIRAMDKKGDSLATDASPHKTAAVEPRPDTDCHSELPQTTDCEELVAQSLKINEYRATPVNQATTTNAMARPSPVLLKATLEVDSFCWPSVCEHLITKAGDEIRAITDELYHEIEQRRNVILVTGHQRGEGRTSTSICLATSLSKAGARVVLVDADIQRPHLARMLGVLPPGGWEEVSASGQGAEEYLIESINDKFAILPLKPETARNEWDSGLPLPIILEQLRDDFDAVLIDAMPLEIHEPSCSMLSACGPFIDTAILLQNKSHQNAKSLLQSTKTLINAGITPLGAIHNTPPMARAA
ncbi:MAG TPA: hypothetical protein QF761_08010 [Pirellulales bacterium]|nr:hypothetical protein [Pirellulales bacterium]